MKKLLLLLFCALVIGCGSPQATAYKSEGVVITTVDTALRAYADYCGSHNCPQSSVDKVHAAYQKYYDAQQVAKLALETYVAAKTDGNAAALQTAQDNVANASQAVIDLVKGLLQ